MKWSALLTPIPCALLFCLANAFKPAVIDDLGYIWYARQIVQTPAKPFGPPPDGFYLIWYSHGQPAFTLLTPMVVPYWLAVGLALFGENLFILKLWLFPFCLLFTASLYALLKRFGPGMERPLLALTIFSPTYLPSLNVMVDVPAIALNLTAIAVFCRALDGPKPRWRLVILAGIVAGLAAQTKYTGMTGVAVILLYGVIRRQKLAAIAAVAIAVALFTGWEAYLTHVYGRSHFLLQLEYRRTKSPVDESANALERFGNEIAATIEKKAGMTSPLFGYLGGLGMPLIPLFLLAWRFRIRIVRWLTAFLLLAFVAMALIPERWATFYRDEHNPRIIYSVGTVLMGTAGVWFATLLAGSTATLGFRWPFRFRRSGASWFLIGWLLIELAGFYLLTPFGAVRRVMGIIVVVTLILGRLLAANRAPSLRVGLGLVSNCDPSSERQRWIMRYTALGILIGLIYAWTDYRDAVAERDALFAGVKLVREQSGDEPRIWFAGHWGFQYYGETAGLQTLYPRESIVEAGDWLIVPEGPRPHSQSVQLAWPFVEKRGVVEIHDSWPLSTNSIYYDGYMPMQRHDGYRLRIAVYRANQRFLAWSD